MLKVPSLPAAEPRSADFAVFVNGVEAPVLNCRVSAFPLNWPWPGHQRPLNQTEMASFCSFDFDEPVEVTVRSLRSVPEKVELRPREFGISASVTGNEISFRLEKPCHFTVEVNGYHNCLHMFTSLPESYDLADGENSAVLSAAAREEEALEKWREAAKTITDPLKARPEDRQIVQTGKLYRFDAGVHEVGNLHLDDGDTVYIAPGAIVYGCLYAFGKKNIRILGHGILDCSRYDRQMAGCLADGKYSSCLAFECCQDLVIDGIICRDPNLWTCSIFRCDRVLIHDIKFVGLWRYNTDGIDVCNSRNVTIRGCFIRAFDDVIVVKGLKELDARSCYGDTGATEHLLVEDCVLWCDWGKTVEIGVETAGEYMRDVTVRNCHCIRSCFCAIDLMGCFRAPISDFLFENISVENDDHNTRFVFQSEEEEPFTDDPADDFVPTLINCGVFIWTGDPTGDHGTVRNITFRDIRCYSAIQPGCNVAGLDSDHTAERIFFENICWNGEKLDTPEKLKLSANEFTADISVR